MMELERVSGWRCPVCSKVWSPITIGCPACNNKGDTNTWTFRPDQTPPGDITVTSVQKGSNDG